MMYRGVFDVFHFAQTWLHAIYLFQKHDIYIIIKVHLVSLMLLNTFHLFQKTSFTEFCLSFKI